MRTHAILLTLLVMSPGLSALPGCASTAIAAKEYFGYAKREQLVDRVRDARDSQEAAKKQFDSALGEFLAVTKVDTGGLEKQYDRLKSDYERCEKRAGEVSGRIVDVRRVADALFAEWKSELSQYSSDQMRSASERQLIDTQGQYQRVLGAMENAEGKMKPVLAAFKDQVLFLKHNLNARAIAALSGTADQINADVQRLIAEMNASIAEANRFIDQMQTK